MKNFALIGLAGFIAPRHLKAIQATGNNLVAALDNFDSVGIIDSYFPEADFFTEFERFDRHLDKLRRKHGKNQVDYLSICTPNYLHDAHIRFALRQGAHAICEKPLVLNPWNIDALREVEEDHDTSVFTILQLRLHPDIVHFKEKIDQSPKDQKHEADLTYITSRGNWYHFSWKGNEQKSGGIATNIGVHFFDMLTWIFGDIQENIVHIHEHDKAAGYLELENARVRWFLSINATDLPEEAKANGKRTFRSIRVDGEEIEFSSGFTDLHTKSYEDILAGTGFGIEDARKSIETVYHIRNSKPIGVKGEHHPLLIS